MPKSSLSQSNRHVRLEACSAKPIDTEPQTNTPEGTWPSFKVHFESEESELTLIFTRAASTPPGWPAIDTCMEWKWDL